MVDRQFKRLGEGTYVCYLNRIVRGVTKTGKPRVSIAYRVAEGPDRGEFVWDNVTTQSDTGFEILSKKLTALMPELSPTFSPENLKGDNLDLVVASVVSCTKDFRYKVDVRPGRTEGFFNVYATRL